MNSTDFNARADLDSVDNGAHFQHCEIAPYGVGMGSGTPFPTISAVVFSMTCRLEAIPLVQRRDFAAESFIQDKCMLALQAMVVFSAIRH